MASSSRQAFESFMLSALRQQPPGHWRQHVLYAVIGLQAEVSKVLSTVRTGHPQGPPPRQVLIRELWHLEYYHALVCYQFNRWVEAEPTTCCSVGTVEGCAIEMVVDAGRIAAAVRDWCFHSAHLGHGAVDALAHLSALRLCLFGMLGIASEEVWQLRHPNSPVAPWPSGLSDVHVVSEIGRAHV